MSSGSASTTGPGRPEVATWKARETNSGAREASSISSTHFASGAKHAATVDLLKSLAAAHTARDLTDEHDERRRILSRHVDCPPKHWWRLARALP